MEAFRKIIAGVTAVAVAITFVGVGFLVCIAPPVTHMLSNMFAQDDISPFSRAQLVKVADATREYSFGNHDQLALYRQIYEVDAEYRDSVVRSGGKVPTDFPSVGEGAVPTNPSELKSVFAGASEMYCYSPDTISHLDDCHAIATSAYPVLVAMAIIAVAGLVFSGVTGGKRRLGSALFGAGITVLVAFVALGVWAAIDFNGLFTTFHQVFFAQQGNWTFPYDSLLICSLPEPFWAGMGAVWLATCVVLSVLAIVVGRNLKVR